MQSSLINEQQRGKAGFQVYKNVYLAPYLSSYSALLNYWQSCYPDAYVYDIKRCAVKLIGMFLCPFSEARSTAR